MKAGDQVKVVAGRGGLFFGRTGQVFRIEKGAREEWVGVRFRDGGKGSDVELPFWFETGEVEVVSNA